MSCIAVALRPEKSILLILCFLLFSGTMYWGTVFDLPLERSRQNNLLNLDQLVFTVALLS